MKETKKRLWKVYCCNKVFFIFTEYKDIAMREAMKMVKGYNDIPENKLWITNEQKYVYNNIWAAEITYSEYTKQHKYKEA